MKVRAVNPGIVKWNHDGTTFAYTVQYHNGSRAVETASDFVHPSAAAAKQAMREHVAFLRRKHGLDLPH